MPPPDRCGRGRSTAPETRGYEETGGRPPQCAGDARSQDLERVRRAVRALRSPRAVTGPPHQRTAYRCARAVLEWHLVRRLEAAFGRARRSPGEGGQKDV